MFKPELYQKNNSAPRRDALRILENYSHKINWGNNDTVIDLGCGDGGVTVDVLKKYIPSTFEKLIGCDIGEEMIRFANDNRGDNTTSFAVLDMAGDLPREWMSAFDHAFSFYAIHWVQQQEKAFANIYNLLSERGDCLLMFVGYIPIYDVYRHLARQIKWQPWLKDAEMFISPYQDSQEPEKRVHHIMAESGFKNIDVKCVEEIYVYSEEEFKNTMEAICPFKLPADLKYDFMQDYMQEVRKMNLIHRDGNNSTVKLHYTLLIAYGTKSQ